MSEVQLTLVDVPKVVDEKLPLQIQKMYHMFGINSEHKCATCKHLDKQLYHDYYYFKCLVYGVSLSASTDWRKKWVACGNHENK